jgi:hypothetical protein
MGSQDVADCQTGSKKKENLIETWKTRRNGGREIEIDEGEEKSKAIPVRGRGDA